MDRYSEFGERRSKSKSPAENSIRSSTGNILVDRIRECLKTFHNFRLVGGNVLGDDTLRLKFDNLKLHLIMWAKASLHKVHKAKIEESIGHTILRLQTLMNDEDKLEEEHGLSKVYDTKATRDSAESKLGYAFHTSYLALVRSHVDLPRKNTRKAWMISNALGYLTLMQLLKELIDDLDAATGSEWAIHEQKAYVADVMLSMSPVDLELITESGLDDNDLIASAACTQFKRIAQKNSSQQMPGCRAADAIIPRFERLTLPLDDDAFSDSLDSKYVLTPQSSKAAVDVKERFAMLAERCKETYEGVSLPSVSIDCLAQRRILSEIRRFSDTPPCISLSLIGSSLSNILGVFVGPPDTPYEDGIFFVRFQIPEQYPLVPPKCRFMTKVYHPNIDANGQVCLNILNKQWQPVWALSDLLLAIAALLQEPNQEDFLVSEVAHMQKTNRRQFEANARDWAEKYATGEWPPLHELEREFLKDTNEDVVARKSVKESTPPPGIVDNLLSRIWRA
ncbi:hypothetical protein MMC10_003173 [Thelotrema lepadinum]|nr:hypothetical protein [Thelotrema lepadinum]